MSSQPLLPYLEERALQYNEVLPKRCRQYLNERGISDEIIDAFLLGWNGWRITIPIRNRDGQIVSYRLAKDPQDRRPAPKMLSSSGATVELYGWEQVLAGPSRIIICEGEFDRLVLESQGFPAVTSTGGAATFRREWADEIAKIDEVFICFDRDNAGRNGAGIVGLMIPKAKVVQLPDEVGEGGDVTDFFVRLAHSRDEFVSLLEKAVPVSALARPVRAQKFSGDAVSLYSLLRVRIDRILRDNPIAKVIGRYLQLHPSGLGDTLMGLCPFHDDRVPSFAVYPRTGTFYCYGCRARGDVISFLRALHNLGFGEALETLDQIKLDDESHSQEDNSRDEAA